MNAMIPMLNHKLRSAGQRLTSVQNKIAQDFTGTRRVCLPVNLVGFQHDIDEIEIVQQPNTPTQPQRCFTF